MITPHDRLRRLETAIPPPAPAAPLELDVFSHDEVRTMTAVAGRNPTFGRGGGLADLSDDDLAALAGIAARVKASRRDGGVMTEVTR